MAVQWFVDGNAHDGALSIVGFASSIIGCLQTASGSLAGVSLVSPAMQRCPRWRMMPPWRFRSALTGLSYGPLARG
jgi:hypothetical protein